MSVEASVFSPTPPLTEPEFRTELERWGTAIRFLDNDGQPLQAVPSGPLAGHFIVVGWPTADAATAGTVDAAIAARDRTAIDQLGQSAKLGWCELGIGPFDYQEHWTKYPDEREEYEESIEPDELAAIKACRTRYPLRSALRPAQCATLVHRLSTALKQATNGAVE